MKLSITTPAGTTNIEGDEHVNITFQEVNENDRSFHQFYLRPSELRSAILAYLNSVPTQDQIAEADCISSPLTRNESNG